MAALIILAFLQSISIHQSEYLDHLKDAVFTRVVNEKLPSIPLTSRVSGMLKNYYGYLPYWIDTTYYQYFQLELLTHIAYFGVDIKPATGGLDSIPNAERFYKIINDAHQHGVKVHMTFIIFGSSSVETFLQNTTARQNAIVNICNFMTNYGIEGANIDFEFVRSSVRDSFNLFINDLADSLWNHPGGRKELYIASIAVPEWYPGYDIGYLSEHCDGLFIMAYDFHYSGSSVAGPVSPAVPSSFWGNYCAARSIGSYKSAGANGDKILLGIPYYGYDWPTNDSTMGASTTGSGSAVIYYYAFQNANNYGRLWDDYSLTPWYRYYNSQWHQCWFDDSVSLDIKYGMVNDSLLQGAGCWALGYDRSYDHLWNTIRRNFWDTTGLCEDKIVDLKTVKFRTIYRNEIILSQFDPDKIYEIEIYDIQGRNLIHKKIVHQRSLKIGEKLCPGIYFIVVKFKNYIFRHKVIKLSSAFNNAG